MAGISFDLAHGHQRQGVSQPARVPAFRQSSPERRNQASRDQLLRRVRAEFEDLRGLKLTLAQATRLFGLRQDICWRILNTLIREAVLHVTPDDQYARRNGG